MRKLKPQNFGSLIGFAQTNVVPKKAPNMLFFPSTTTTMSEGDLMVLQARSVKSTSSNDDYDESSTSTYCRGDSPRLSSVPVHAATPDDIIVGSRGTHHSGPGNDRFNEIIDSFIPKYSNASSKAAKGKVFLEIFQTVSCFGRFLTCDPKTGLYYEVGEYVAKEKISHALRYRKKRMNKKKKPNGTNTQGPPTSLEGLLAAERKVRFHAATSHLHLFQSRPDPQPSHTSSDIELFSDEDLVSVLGGPREFDWPVLSPPGESSSSRPSAL